MGREDSAKGWNVLLQIPDQINEVFCSTKEVSVVLGYWKRERNVQESDTRIGFRLSNGVGVFVRLLLTLKPLKIDGVHAPERLKIPPNLIVLIR